MTDDRHGEEELQPSRFSSRDFASPVEALARFRELTAPIADVTIPGEPADFHLDSVTYPLSGALLIESRTSGPRYDRTERHLAHGYDHLHVALYLQGGAEFIAQNRSYALGSGDIGLIDMARPSVTREILGEGGVCHVMSFLTPRPLLTPLLRLAPDGAAVRILRQETPYGAMLRDFLLAFRRSAARLTQGESQSAVQALAQLVAGGFAQPPSDGPAEAGVAHEDLRRRVQAYIEDNLSVATLGVGTLCAQFALSRTSLYRLFAPQTPVGYIQHRRLQRAFAMLISPAFRGWRVLDIALECHFSSDATFIRAFRREFGLSPGEARRLAGRPIPGVPARSERPELQPDAAAVHWIARLTGSLLPDRQGPPPGVSRTPPASLAGDEATAKRS